MSNSNYGKVAASGMLWQLIERISSALLQFVLTTILARLLLPEEYGIIAIIMVFITISDLLVIAGLGTAIIQGKNIDQVTLSSVFYFSIFASAIVYGILFFLAPEISYFYKEPIVSPILRLYSIVILPTAVNNLLRSMLLKELKYKKVFFSSIIPLFISGVIGVVCAVLGAGVYAMAIQALSYACLFSVNDNTLLYYKMETWFVLFLAKISCPFKLWMEVTCSKSHRSWL